MILVLTLLCRNEEDIISSTINFHLSQGIDKIIVTDNASTDGTRSILKTFERDERVIVLDEVSHTHDQSKWVTRMSNVAKDDLGANWIIHSDADEFWLPKHGSLRDCLSSLPCDCDAISIKRSNLLPPPLGCPSTIPFYESMTIKEKQSLNSFGYELPPKVCHRSLADITVADGNHTIYHKNTTIPAPLCSDIEIFHYPVRSFRQFEQKIRLGSKAIESNQRIKDTMVGSTWRYLYHEHLLKGSLFEYYMSMRPKPDRLTDQIASGEMLYDTRVRDLLRLHKLTP